MRYGSVSTLRLCVFTPFLCDVLLKTAEAKHMEEWQSMEEAQDIEELLSLDLIRNFHTGPTILRMLSLFWSGMMLAFVGCPIIYGVVHDEDKMKVV